LIQLSSYNGQVRIQAFLKESPLFQVNRAARACDIHLARILKGREMGFIEALVLVAVFFEEPRPVQPSRLAETLATTRANISHCVSSLEAREMVRRRIDPADARAFHLQLRPQGRKAAIEVIRTFDHMQRQLEKRIGAAQIKAALTVIEQVEHYCSAVARG
jgi:DNA-binding MarR family transcriptional regulator